VADRVAFGFDGPDAQRTRQAVVTGNPVRSEIEQLPPPEQRFAGRSGPLRMLVVGGSLGAQALNSTVPAALALIDPAQRPVVTHQTGNAHHAAVASAYAEAGVEAEVLPFIDDMAARLAACDLMVCRAGAGTVSELCAAGVPGLLVPLIVSTTAHQRDNAEHMARAGAGLHLPQAGLTPAALPGSRHAAGHGDARPRDGPPPSRRPRGRRDRRTGEVMTIDSLRAATLPDSLRNPLQGASRDALLSTGSAA
jgi:UDP-N-acetylglucosamine--N-acetylmuramyl-(pentapeptide) pyrophosphoryl-undecaprenol N-acetylglucosamine transferase